MKRHTWLWAGALVLVGPSLGFAQQAPASGDADVKAYMAQLHSPLPNYPWLKQAAWDRLQANMDALAVGHLLGKPTETNVSMANGMRQEWWYYRYTHHNDPNQSYVGSLRFVGGRLYSFSAPSFPVK